MILIWCIDCLTFSWRHLLSSNLLLKSECLTLCLFRELRKANFFSHKLQANPLLLVCVTWCSIMWEVLEKLLPHVLQMCGRKSACIVLMCLFIELRSLNLFSQWSHLSGLSFVWVLMCCFKLNNFLNCLLQKWQILKEFKTSKVLLFSASFMTSFLRE